jgi:dissimilatory sulfite reductase (desulfoviridin) alpha/beta subunit
MKEITVEEIMGIIENTVEIYNSEYDLLKEKFQRLLTKKITVEEIMGIIENTVEIYNSEYDLLKEKFQRLLENKK